MSGTGDLPPLFQSLVSAGFPQTADDLVESPLDLNEYIVKHPSATYFVRVKGDSMINAGIYPGDILVVDRSITPYDGAIIIAALDGDFTVKRYIVSFGRSILRPENPAYKDININEEQQFEVWGVVTHSIRHQV